MYCACLIKGFCHHKLSENDKNSATVKKKGEESLGASGGGVVKRINIKFKSEKGNLFCLVTNKFT